MAKNYFFSNNPNSLREIYQKLLLWFKERQYDVDHTETDGIYLIQARKTGTFRTLTGTNLAFKIKIYWSESTLAEKEFILETSTGKWISNLAGAGIASMFTGGFTILTGIAGAGWGLVVENEIVTYVENSLNFTKVKKDNEVTTEGDSANAVNSTTSESTTSDSGKTKLSARELAVNQAQKDLDKLQAAYESEILTEEEFKAKKLNLDEKIDEYEIEFVLEEQLAKLENAFTHGILNEQEYEQKLATVHDTVKEQILKKRTNKNKEILKIKLKEALEDGVISEAEYQAKLAAL